MTLDTWYFFCFACLYWLRLGYFMVEHTSATTRGAFCSQPERCNNAGYSRKAASHCVQSVIRARDVQELTRSAQYNPPVDYSALDVFSEEEKAKAEGSTKSPLAKRGFVHIPSAKAPGGVIACGPIVRDITVNLIALRRLPASEGVQELRRYILGLSLVAATHPLDGFLRQGCLLTPDPLAPSEWVLVERDGKRTAVELDAPKALEYAQAKAKTFVVNKGLSVTFEKASAKSDLRDKKKEKAKKGSKETAGSDAAGA